MTPVRGADAPVSGLAPDAASGPRVDAASMADTRSVDGPGDAAVGGASAPPSCRGLPATCGAGHDESCCTSLPVPGGTFNRLGDAKMPATVSSFHLDRFEVTVGRFRKFVAAYDAWRAAGHPAAGEGVHPRIAGSGWDAAWTARLTAGAALQGALACGTPEQRGATTATWTAAPGPNENRPVSCVTWYEAFAFCDWDGGRLPTEWEMAYAVAGGSEQRYFPWSVPPSSMAMSPAQASYECTIRQGIADCVNEVGTKPAGNGKFGQADLGGNVWEWMLDWEGNTPGTCVDCAVTKPEAGANPLRRVRGGGWPNGASGMSSVYQGVEMPGNRQSNQGFRCARDP